MKPVPMDRDDLIQLVEQHFSCRLGAQRARATTRYGGQELSADLDKYRYRVLIWRKQFKTEPSFRAIREGFKELHAQMWGEFYDLWDSCRRAPPALYWRYESKIKDESAGTDLIQVYTRVAIPAANWHRVEQMFDSVHCPRSHYL